MSRRATSRNEKPELPAEHVRKTDCINGMTRLDKESVDVVVTSPPYNIGTNYNTYMDDLEQEKYLEWCLKWTRSIRKVLKEKGSFFLNLGSSPTNPTIPHTLIYKIAEDGNFVLQNTIHWIKAITILNDKGEELSKGHFKPIP